MASSYFTESEAPRDFRVSSTESDAHYKKCLLCYTVKRNFYCADCIRAGNFVHSSMPYSDRYAEKQAKLLRMKVNRKHILDRCERLLSPKLKRDTLLTEVKQSRDSLDLLRLAIEQRRNSIEEKRRELTELKSYNNELSLKLPRYQKRVASLGKHAQLQRMELHYKISSYNDQAESLASVRRARIRQLTRYIFPLYMSYDTSESIEDMEFVLEGGEAESPRRPRLHIVAPWITADGDLTHEQPSAWGGAGAGAGAGAVAGAAGRSAAALALCAQLVAQVAWTVDARLPTAVSLSDYCGGRAPRGGLRARARRLAAASAALWRAPPAAPPVAPPGAPPVAPTGAPPVAPVAAPRRRTLDTLHALAVAANTDDPMLGRVGACGPASDSEEGAGAGEDAGAEEGADAWGADDADDTEPEHLHWPETVEMDELSCSPPSPAPAPPPSLVTSAAATLASMWRGWTH